MLVFNLFKTLLSYLCHVELFGCCGFAVTEQKPCEVCVDVYWCMKVGRASDWLYGVLRWFG